MIDYSMHEKTCMVFYFPIDIVGECGVAFTYQTDRCYGGSYGSV